MQASSVQEAYAHLVRASSLAGRPGIVILDEDLSALHPPDGSATAVHSLLAAVEREGYLRRVRRGAYVLVDSAGGIRTGLLDLVAAVTPKPYLLTAGRALQFHELSDQHFRRVHVLVPTQLRSWSWRGDEVRYSRTDRSLRGASTRTQKTRANVATAERAIADSLAHPKWGVTLTQVVEALDTLLGRDPSPPSDSPVRSPHTTVTRWRAGSASWSRAWPERTLPAPSWHCAVRAKQPPRYEPVRPPPAQSTPPGTCSKTSTSKR